MNDTGRPEIVYGPRSPFLEHGVLVTWAEIVLGCRLVRNVPFGKAIADGAFTRLATGLYEVAREILDDSGRKEPIARIEVCRLLGKVHVHCIPVRIVRRRRA